jgi:hypothetical protein
MVFTAYSAVIINHLAFLKPTLPFHTLKGLLDDGTYNFEIRTRQNVMMTFKVRKFKHWLLYLNTESLPRPVSPERAAAERRTVRPKVAASLHG